MIAAITVLVASSRRTLSVSKFHAITTELSSNATTTFALSRRLLEVRRARCSRSSTKIDIDEEVLAALALCDCDITHFCVDCVTFESVRLAGHCDMPGIPGTFVKSLST